MNVLFISNDPSIFVETSESRTRMREYAGAIGSLHILMRSPGAPQVISDGPLTIEGIETSKMDAPRKLAARARVLVAGGDVQVVSAQDPFEHGWAALQAIKGTDVKLHIQVHTDFLSPWFVRGGIFRSPQVSMPLKNTLRLHLADKVLPNAHGIRVVSERVRDSLVRKYGTRIPVPAVIPIAVSSQLPEPVELPTHSFPFALITVGRLEPEKRMEDILAALVILKDRYPAIGLIIVGDGREKAALMKMVVEKGLTGKVIFAGARADAWGLMRSAQAYIQASAYEGYGRTLVEAALARLPIVTTDVGIIGEVFKGYEDVLATPPGDPTNLSYHIISVLEDVGNRELMIRSAEAKAKAHLEKYANLADLIARDLSTLSTGSTTV